MKTSCFYTYQGPGRISIARREPRGIKGYRRYPALAPRHDMLRMPYEEYRPLYFDILNALDPEEVWQELHRLAEPYEPVLLCWEKPPLTSDNWCHRQLVQTYFKDTLGFIVEELNPHRHG